MVCRRAAVNVPVLSISAASDGEGESGERGGSLRPPFTDCDFGRVDDITNFNSSGSSRAA